MKSDTIATVGLTVGAVALVGGAYWLSRKPAKPAKPAPSAALPNPQAQPQTPTPTYSNPGTQAPVGPSNADLLAAIQQQQAAAAQQQQQAALRGFIDRIGATENQEILLLTQIDAINDDNSRLNDFTQQYENAQLSSTRFTALSNACHDAVYRNCPNFLGLGNCAFSNVGQCFEHSSELNNYNQGDWNGNTLRNAWALIADEAAPWAAQQLDAWKASQRAPLEAKLVYYEVQYKGMVAELKNNYGVDYSPNMGADYIRAHSSANSAISRGVKPDQNAVAQTYTAVVPVPSSPAPASPPPSLSSGVPGDRPNA